MSGSLCSYAAVSVDSLMDLPAMGVPIINYSPETKWVFGGAVQGYFRTPGQSKTSIVQADGAYTLQKQWYLNVSGNIYFGGKTPWQLQFSGGYRDYPDYFYTLGNGYDGLQKSGKRYNSRRGKFNIQPLFLLPHNWSIGPVVDFIAERYELPETVPDTVRNRNDILMWGPGVIVQYDSRDILFFPSNGLFFKSTIMYYEPALGSDCRLINLSADIRQFIPVPLNQTHTMVIAWQFKTQWVLSSSLHDIPFQMLPTLGGQDLVRGVRSGMYRDNALMALQTEIRLPIWKILHATVFAGVGDVYNTEDWHWTTPKIGYGLGLRLCINRAKVNIRLDIARNNIDKAWNNLDNYSFYLTATEAF